MNKQTALHWKLKPLGKVRPRGTRLSSSTCSNRYTQRKKHHYREDLLMQ